MASSERFISRLPKLPMPAQMRQWDTAAVKFGIPENMLMENAGRALCAALLKIVPQIRDKAILLFMGGGNNGGDAACMARHLLDAGARPLVCHIVEPDKLRGAAAWHTRLAMADGVPFHQIDLSVSENFAHPGSRILDLSPEKPVAIVDGILGTGFHGELGADFIRLITAINDASHLFGCPVLAIDTPSGLDSATGTPSPVAIKATTTITLGAAKPGLVLPQARKWTGSVYVRPIGLPAITEKEQCAEWRLLDGRALLCGHTLPQNSYKNIYGHIFVIGGSQGMEGAAHLACAAALRSGCGLVTATAPASSLTGIKNSWPEIMTRAIGDDELWPQSPDLSSLSTATALVVGPGLGRGRDSAEFLSALLHVEHRPPAVFDADALMLIAKERSLLGCLTERDILTPHPGEAAALLLGTPGSVQQNRRDSLLRLTDLSPAAVALKGSATLIGQRGQPCLVCPYDIPQLAIAGAGDVLSGCAGAMLVAENYDALAAAAMAVLLHAMTGLILAREYPNRGALASDLADALPRVKKFIQYEYGLASDAGLAPWPPSP